MSDLVSTRVDQVQCGSLHHRILISSDARTRLAIWQLGNCASGGWCLFLFGYRLPVTRHVLVPGLPGDKDALPGNPAAQECIPGASLLAFVGNSRYESPFEFSVAYV